MKLIKILIILAIISFSFSFSFEENIKKGSLKGLRRKVNQKSSGLCGFVGVLEAALDLDIKVDGKKTDSEFQDMLPTFIVNVLTKLKNENNKVFQSIFKETKEYLKTILESTDKWYLTADEMLSKVVTDMAKKDDYSGFKGLYISFDNLKEIAQYAKLPFDTSETSKTSQTKQNGILNLPIKAVHLKKYKGCIVGITKPKSRWQEGDSLYIESKAIATRHWIYVTKDETLKNWGQNLSFKQMVKNIKNQNYTTITEALCFKKDK